MTRSATVSHRVRRRNGAELNSLKNTTGARRPLEVGRAPYLTSVHAHCVRGYGPYLSMRLLAAPFNTPPCEALTGRLRRIAHDPIAEGHERSGSQRLREEVSQVVSGLNKGHCDFHVFYAFPDKEMAPIYVLGPFVMLRVIGQIVGGLIVCGQLRSSPLWGTPSSSRIFLK